MCGRFAFFSLTPEVFQQFGVAAAPAGLRPRYNIAPLQQAAVVLEDGGRRLQLMLWGLVPHWAGDDRSGGRLINARRETLAERPSFRQAFSKRRCLVPADGFFEWRAQGRRKQPYFIYSAGGRPLGLAGLWEIWSKGAEPLYTFTIVTSPATPQLSVLHERMPLVVPPEKYDLWLNAPEAEAKRLMELPCSVDLIFGAVSARVNSARADDPSLLEPLVV